MKITVDIHEIGVAVSLAGALVAAHDQLTGWVIVFCVLAFAHRGMMAAWDNLQG